MSRLLKTGLLFSLAFFCMRAALGQGLEVAPLFLDVAARPGGEAQLRIENGFSTPAAFTVQLRRRDLAPDGTELGTSVADDDFLVYPPQFLVAPTTSQIVRLQWLGQRPLQRTEAYYLVVEQLPLTLGDQPSEAGAEVTMLISVFVHLYVSPPEATSDIVISNAAAQPDGQLVLIDILNEGARYALLRHGVLSIECLNDVGSVIRSARFAGDDLAAILPSTLVPANGRRTITVPFEGSADCRSVTAQYNPDPDR